MLVRTDPFRDLNRFTEQVLGTAARPAVMPMDAWREGEEFVVEFDLPGIKEDSLDLDIERNVVTVRAERPGIDPARENLDTEKIDATYDGGVLRLRIPVAERAKPRKIAIGGRNGQHVINA
jgi:HSP20 family protein